MGIDERGISIYVRVYSLKGRIVGRDRRKRLLGISAKNKHFTNTENKFHGRRHRDEAEEGMLKGGGGWEGRSEGVGMVGDRRQELGTRGRQETGILSWVKTGDTNLELGGDRRQNFRTG